MRKLRKFRSLNRYDTHHLGWAAVAAAGISAAGSIAGGAMGASAAEGAAGISAEAAELGIKEVKAALGPSMLRLAKAQGWSDAHLLAMYRQSMRSTQPYAQSGRQGLSRLNYLTGQDNGLGPAPTAPVAPKPPKYAKDPKEAAAQKQAYNKSVRQYGRQKKQYDLDSAGYQSRTAAAAGDPEFGSLTKPYDDRFEGRIDEVAKREYVDKHGYGQRILDVAGEKFDDRLADRILGISEDTFEADDFETDPGYEFRRDEGNRGVLQSAAARGSVQSGAAQKALVGFNQGLASDEYGKAFDRWSNEHNRALTGYTGQQAQEYGAFRDSQGTRIGALAGERAHDYGVFGDQKNTELGSLVNRRDFDFGNFDNNRKFQYGSLMDQVGIGQDATDDRNQARQFYSTARTGNALKTAETQGNWQQNMAAQIAELLGQKGNAQAAGQVGAANAYSSAFQGIGNTLGTMAGYYYGGNNRFGRGGNTRGGGHAGQGLMGNGQNGWNW